MKIFKLMMVAFVAMLAFTACDKETEHIYDDHSADLVGTWTCLTPDFAEALIINADGSLLSTGLAAGEYWENVAGNVVVENGNITLTFKDDDNFKGHFDIIPGVAFSIYNDKGGHLVFNYCANDLSDEIVGMWVCNDAPAGADNDMAIISYANDGSTTFTGILPNKDGYMLNVNTTYNVVGDLMFKKNAVQGTSDSPKYISTRLTYAPNGTGAGDIMVYKHYNGTVETSSSYLRIKQSLDLANMSYDYISCYITNAKGVDKDIKFLNTTFNFAKMDGSIIDKFLRSILFSVNFPDANTIEYRCLLEGNYLVSVAPIEVEGNKMTLKMSSRHEAYRDVEIYTFQDADNTQMHMYMPTTSFENFFSNMSLSLLSSSGQVDINNPVHVEAVYKEVADAVESINLSIVCKNTTTRAL